MTKKTDSKKSVIARKPATKLSQGVEGLLGAPATEAPKKPPKPAKKAKSRKATPRKPKTERKPPADKPKTTAKGPRVTFSLRYGVEYVRKLEMLYLQERAKRGGRFNKVQLVEEALDLLFEKYDFE